MRVEDKIRDYLADNICFIANDLILIEKEFKLNAEIGAKGFIDILARDSLNNYVVIEIKRSNSASRQTMNELLKYQGLLKQQLGARESEIKLVIISTTWHELITPFSEFYSRVSLEGYEIGLDAENIPITIKKIEPLNLNSSERKISPQHSLNLFLTLEKRDQFIEVLQDRIKAKNVSDFIIIKLKKENDARVMYPYSAYFVFRRLERIFYLKLNKKLEEEIRGMDFDNEEDEICYIEDNFLATFNMHEYNDTAESGYPEKISRMIENEKWEIEKIIRFGIFKKDPRFTDEMLLNEVKGFDGTNDVKFLDFADSTQPKKIEQIKLHFKNCINSRSLIRKIDEIFSFIESKNQSYRVIIDIFYPYSAFDSLWSFSQTNDENLLPQYNLFFILNDAEEIFQFYGILKWNKKKVLEKDLLGEIGKYKEGMLLFIIFNKSIDNKILKILNLKFPVSCIIVSAKINS